MGKSLPPGVRYFSSFGGLWTDRSDVEDELQRRLDMGLIKDLETDQLQHWITKGYVILPGAVDTRVCDRLRADIEGAWRQGDERLAIFPPGTHRPMSLTSDSPVDKMRVVDIYVYYESALEALFSPAVARFLSVVFDEEPLLFQSLSFEQGSQQGMHQDAAYVVVDSPLEFAACWIALEDVVEGSGELMYYEGSHRLPEYRFSGEFKHWNPDRDGSGQHTEWGELLHENAAALGMPRRTFLPKKGDALIWSADLAHGGSPNVWPGSTRRSLVGHYCPRSRSPHYFSYLPHRRSVVAWGPGHYSSAHYDVEVASRGGD